ncbi:MAG: hypothetical protein IMZ60_02765 [Actinobacteria bacterium]|nr:hypothetical protein [Actinomycetota bacterium]
MNGVCFKLHPDFRKFLSQLKVHRIQEGKVDNITEGHIFLSKLMFEFFKSDKEAYNKLVNFNMENGKK